MKPAKKMRICNEMKFSFLYQFDNFSSISATSNRWSKTEEYVIKVEPHTNGPLFVELHFYCRATHKEDIEEFKTSQKMKHLGIPDLKGCGSFLYKNKRLRFIVMPRYGKDLQTILEEQKSEKLTCKQASDIGKVPYQDLVFEY